MYYDGTHENCMEHVPVAIPREAFCAHLHGDARVFRVYQPWVLAMLLGQAHHRLHSYPATMFRAAAWTLTGRGNCAMDAPPLVSSPFLELPDG